MIKSMDELIYYPSTRKTLTGELVTAIHMYQSHKMTNDQFYFFIEHYVNNFSHLLFSGDYDLHQSIVNNIGRKNTLMLRSVIKEIRQSRLDRM